ncbi:MAG: glycosyltransferase [Myxococcota bacterium]
MGNAPPRLALCMIVRNEAEMLPECLASVADVVDEVIVVDTGSTDATVAIAEAAGARVAEHPWHDDFSAPRNHALGLCEAPWVLVLDADERLAPGAGVALRRALADDDFDCGLVALHNAERVDAPPDDVVRGEARLNDVAHLPRVLRRTADLRYEGLIHESVSAWLARGRRPRFLTGVDVVHLGGVPDLRARRDKGRRNIALLERALERDPNDVDPYGYLAHEHFEAGDRDKARDVAARGWRLVERGVATTELGALRLATVHAWLQIGARRSDAALVTVARAFSYAADHPDLFFLRGCAHEATGLGASSEHERRTRFSLASDAYRHALAQADRLVVQNFIQGSSGWAAHVRLGTVRLLLDDHDTAREAFEHAMRLRPGHREAVWGHAEALLGAGMPVEAMRQLQSALDDRPDGWVLAALGAEAAGMVEEMDQLLGRAQLCLADAPFFSPHRRERYDDAVAIMTMYRGEPRPGRGPWGQVASLMHGERVWREGARVRALDPEVLRRAIEHLLHRGQRRWVTPLLAPEAAVFLPGIDRMVHAIVDAFVNEPGGGVPV